VREKRACAKEKASARERSKACDYGGNCHFPCRRAGGVIDAIVRTASRYQHSIQSWLSAQKSLPPPSEGSWPFFLLNLLER
jgi:hypothetical protein